MGRKNSKRNDYAPYSGQKHVFFYTDVIESAAYADLSSDAKVLMLEMGYRWGKTINGSNDANGEFQFSTGHIQAALGGSASKRATNAFRELVEHGFVEIMELENWVQRDARKLRLTWQKCNGEWPTKDWKRWKPGFKVFEVPKHRNAKIKPGRSKQESTNRHYEGQYNHQNNSQSQKLDTNIQRVNGVRGAPPNCQIKGEYISPSLLLQQEINSHG